MATQKKSVHSVGNINSPRILTIPNCFAKEDTENYSLVQLAYEEDRRVFSYLTDADKAYLLAAVEVMYDNESYEEFYVGKDEGGRIVHLKAGLRFETTNFLPIGSSTAPAKGQYAFWDATEKKFQLVASVPATPVADTMFEVVNVGAGEYGFGKTMVRFEVL